MKNFFRNYLLNIIVILLFTSFALWFALKDNAATVFEMLKHINPIGIIFVIAAALLYHLIVGYILQQFTRLTKPDYTLKEGFVNALVAAFFHGVTPSASGGQISQVYVFHKQGVAGEQSASILIMDFIVYQSCMVVVSALLLLFRYHYFAQNSFFILAILGFVVNMAVIAILSLCSFSPKIYTWVTRKGISLLAKIKIVKDKEKALDGLNAKLVSFDKGIKDILANRKVLIKTVVANVIRLVLYFSIPLICAYAANIKVNSDFLTVIALTSYVTNINAFIPIPGASGGTEAVFVLMYSMIVTSVEASTLMLLWRFSTYHIILIIGAIVFIVVQNSKTKEIKR